MKIWLLVPLILSVASQVIASNLVIDNVKQEKNHIYAMASGASLLMDVYTPLTSHRSNIGVVFIMGNGWFADESYSAKGLKMLDLGYPPADQLSRHIVTQLVNNGFTVFVPDYRGWPDFNYPTPIEDLAEAIKYIKSNQKLFGLQSNQLVGVGISAGANLTARLLTDDSLPPISRLSTGVALAGPMDLVKMYNDSPGGSGTLAAYFGYGIAFLDPSHNHVKAYKNASPITHFDDKDGPLLLIHGKQDTLVPYSQSVDAIKILTEQGMKGKLVLLEDAGHTENWLMAKIDWMQQLIEWLSVQH